MNTEVAAPKDDKTTAPKLTENQIRQFKSKAPKAGEKSFDYMLGLDGPDDAAVICPWEEFGEAELSELAQYGII